MFCVRRGLLQVLNFGAGRRLLSGAVGGKLCAVPLEETRSLIKLEGPDALGLLQGLITSDVGTLEEGTDKNRSIYALFLNHQGRVLWDTLVYRRGAEETWLECDKTALEQVIKHLKTFKLRKKVDISAEEERKLWVAFERETKSQVAVTREECCGSLVRTEQRTDFPVELPPSWLCFGDPRLPQLGWRLIAPISSPSSPSSSLPVDQPLDYRNLRYSLGVGEGTEELPQGNCFPLESNGDYLQGISFSKGCYLGQELTARTHHTGVVRKRLMPVTLSAPLPPDTKPVELLHTSSKKVLGKVRGVSGTSALVLTRVEEALAALPGQLQIHGVTATVRKPIWWPQEAGKERQTRQ